MRAARGGVEPIEDTKNDPRKGRAPRGPEGRRPAGARAAVARLGRPINTAYIERPKVTFRELPATLTRRPRMCTCGGEQDMVGRLCTGRATLWIGGRPPQPH